MTTSRITSPQGSHSWCTQTTAIDAIGGKLMSQSAAGLGERSIRVNPAAPWIISIDMSRFNMTEAGRGALKIRAVKRVANPR